MKRVGIITLHGYSNYGNKLQNYATQEVLKSLGCDSITIANDVSINQDRKIQIYNKLKRLSFKRMVNHTYIAMKKLRQKVYLTNTEKKETLLTNKRIERFKKFTKDNIIESDYIINERNVSKDFHNEFDYFIVGSDQVWNPYYINNSSIYFLTFAPKRKRIAYSASFGISQLPEAFTQFYKERISQFEHISVREEVGADIVRDLIGRSVEVLIDPTLMLDKNEWLEIASKSKHKPTKSYILTYFLGEESEKIKGFVDNLSYKYDLEIVKLEEGSGIIKDELRYTTGPGEFIDYVNSAKVILTDSFHGTVFSILFEKPFISFSRNDASYSMNISSRLDTLLRKFQLEDRKWDNIKESNNIMEIDFSNVPKILKREREKAYKYLRVALDIEGKYHNE